MAPEPQGDVMTGNEVTGDCPGRSRPFSILPLLLVTLAGFCVSAAPGSLWAQDTTAPGTPAPGTSATGTSLEQLFGGQPPASLADLRRMEARQRELSEQAIGVTVGVRIGPAQGSGVIITSDGLVLTAAHVAQKPGLDVVFVLPDGNEVHGKTLGMNREIDAGMMRITDAREGGWPHAEMGDYSKVTAGQWVLATGHPGGYEEGRKPVVRVGRVLRKHSTVMVTDCPLIGGDSGGPMFDMQGKVVGIHSRIGGSLTANMHVPIGAFQDDWDRLLKGDMWGRVPPGSPVIGVGGANVEGVKGARIDTIREGGPGAQAGLQRGDIVVRFGREQVDDFESLILAVSRSTPGERVRMRVRRGDRELDLEVVIGVSGG